MKTTLMLDDAIVRRAKLQAARQSTTMSGLVNASLYAYLQTQPTETLPRHHFRMPVFTGSATGVELTPVRIAELRDDGR